MPPHPSLRAGRTATAALLAVTAAGTLTATALAYVDNHGSLRGGAGATATPDATAASDGVPANATTAPTPALSPGTGPTHARSSGS
ncbi:hypothetical protein [Nocardia niigatensis]